MKPTFPIVSQVDVCDAASVGQALFVLRKGGAAARIQTLPASTHEDPLEHADNTFRRQPVAQDGRGGMLSGKHSPAIRVLATDRGRMRPSARDARFGHLLQAVDMRRGPP